jgi:hypothetical protein
MHRRDVALRGSTGKSEVFVILIVFAASCAARKRLAPATISKPSAFGRTVMGWMRPCCLMLSAFCSLAVLWPRRRRAAWLKAVRVPKST